MIKKKFDFDNHIFAVIQSFDNYVSSLDEIEYKHYKKIVENVLPKQYIKHENQENRIEIVVNTSNDDNESELKLIDDLFESLTTYISFQFSKIKTIIGYRKAKNKWTYDLTSFERKCLNELTTVGKIITNYLIKSNLYRKLYEYTKKVNKYKKNFFKDILKECDTNIQHVIKLYKLIFKHYGKFPTTDLMNIIYLSMYYEFISKKNSQDSGPDEEIAYLTSYVRGAGPIFLKLLQRFAMLIRLREDYSSVLRNSYEDIPKLKECEIRGILNYLGDPKLLIDNKKELEIFQTYDFSSPMSVASVGQVHKFSFEGEEYIFKFIKPRTVLNIISEIFMGKNSIFPTLKNNTLNRKVKQYFQYIALNTFFEFNFLKEKENIETIRDVYEVEEYNISSVNIPKKEPFTLDSIPHIWMNIVEGETINTLIKRNDEINCRKIVPIFKKLLLHWFLTGVFKDGRFHADIHGGNVIIKNKNDKLVMTLIDFGNCSTLRENEQKAVLKTIKKHYEIVKLIRDGYFCRKASKEDIKDCIRELLKICLLYTSPSPRDRQKSRMPSSA